MSDLHLDFPGAGPIPAAAPRCDVVMVAGDTCRGLVKAVDTLRSAFPDVEVVTVAGNHELHGNAFEDELGAGRMRARELGVHLLERASVRLGNVVVVGATLWTDYELFGEALRVPAMHAAAETMRDHKCIKWRKSPWMRFRPQEARAVHLQSRRFIEDALARIASEGRRAIVLTHHAASIEAVDPRLQRSIVSAAYASELLPIVDRHRPAAWVSGHTHRPMNFRRAGCRMISNPRGYPGEGVTFDPACIFEVSDD